jgi:hypothetical protein
MFSGMTQLEKKHSQTFATPFIACAIWLDERSVLEIKHL